MFRFSTIGLRFLLALAVLPPVAAAPVAAEPTSRTVLVGVRGNMEATLYTPDGPGPFPSVVVLHTSQGLTEADRQYCARLAREGFICIVPAFLRAYGIKQDMKMTAFTADREAILADFRQIIGELDRQPKARLGAVGAIGFSNGGLFSVLLAAQQQVKAGVAYYGALVGVMQPRSNNPFLQSFTSASAPVLLLAGANDTTMGIEPVRALEGIIKAAGSPYELIAYPDAEHGFDRNNLRLGNGAAAADAWTRTLAFLRKYVR
ncbi:MAG: dienelactone hydrolase family protein [Rhodospirillaceae bacterium]|nr:dienelactone hydrolase family protein [Rhodospirillaceae bacterium]